MNKTKIDNLLDMSAALCTEQAEADKNLFEMANLKEYRHSAILGYLLNRMEQGQKVHLKSFLFRVFNKAISIKGDLNVECEKLIEVNESKRPIDILITAKDFALIIENKCRGASDQPSQIFDYWKGVKNMGFADSDIHVLYLPPMNAFASPSADSLDGLSSRFAVGGDLAGHLLTHTYRDLILPWLREDVLPNVGYGSGNLVNSLKCYIDLLEGMFGEHSDNRDVRLKTTNTFSKLLKEKDSDKLWDHASEILEDIDKVMGDKGISEMTGNALGDLQRALWDVRSVLREQNPLLDPPNLSYEVYWLLRKNPTPFASRVIRAELDSGLFFKKGRRQSAYDNTTCEILGKEHGMECWFHVDEFVKYCKGMKAETILTFGIGEVSESNLAARLMTCLKKEDRLACEYLPEAKWLTVYADNDIFADAKESYGDVSLAKDAGEAMLWYVAEAIANEAKRFSEQIMALR